ncbi:MAG: GNAT family N-acetyltransferase [Alicyclobacillus herbarius]|uniref:GNAT family N-acetyltransferase n=1 Tax=Alicyclobacillus herbarius TaxID=122960 RepID=UPI002357AD7C|nr:GNAT family N-acetyltransferase [Alicyclobacillus herbarius]MCL6631736.1 GNAT family N-acetyltransferase [Alicyclobacillus herbarius]
MGETKCRVFPLANGHIVELHQSGGDLTDVEKLKEMLRHESKESLYLRFFRLVNVEDEALVNSLLPEPGRTAMSLVCERDGHMVGVASYQALDTESVELAALVADAEQGCGIGSLLLEELERRARDTGYRKAIVHVLLENRRGFNLLRKHGFRVDPARTDWSSGEAVLVAPLTVLPAAQQRPLPA